MIIHFRFIVHLRRGVNSSTLTTQIPGHALSVLRLPHVYYRLGLLRLPNRQLDFQHHDRRDICFASDSCFAAQFPLNRSILVMLNNKFSSSTCSRDCVDESCSISFEWIWHSIVSIVLAFIFVLFLPKCTCSSRRFSCWCWLIFQFLKQTFVELFKTLYVLRRVKVGIKANSSCWVQWLVRL